MTRWRGMLSIVPALSIAMLAASCQRDDDGDDPVDDFDAFCQDYQERRCDLSVACGFFADRAACENVYDCPPRTERWRALADEGRLVFDPEAAQVCLDAFASADCRFLATDEPTLCGPALAGQAGEGAQCTDELDCAPDTWCDTSACPGTCRDFLARGAACRRGDLCEAGLYCNPLAEMCMDIPEPVDEGMSCSSAPCDDGLRCDIHDLLCVPLSDAGGDCIFDSDCLEGLACTADLFPGECSADALAAPGESCPGGSEQPHCGAGYTCAFGTCQLPGHIGDDCDVDASRPCVDGYCDTTTRDCEPLKADGAPCADGDECSTGLCTDGQCAGSCQW